VGGSKVLSGVDVKVTEELSEELLSVEVELGPVNILVEGSEDGIFSEVLVELFSEEFHSLFTTESVVEGLSVEDLVSGELQSIDSFLRDILLQADFDQALSEQLNKEVEMFVFQLEWAVDFAEVSSSVEVVATEDLSEEVFVSIVVSLEVNTLMEWLQGGIINNLLDEDGDSFFHESFTSESNPEGFSLQDGISSSLDEESSLSDDVLFDLELVQSLNEDADEEVEVDAGELEVTVSLAGRLVVVSGAAAEEVHEVVSVTVD